MRYINLRLTYLLTYTPVCVRCVTHLSVWGVHVWVWKCVCVCDVGSWVSYMNCLSLSLRRCRRVSALLVAKVPQVTCHRSVCFITVITIIFSVNFVIIIIITSWNHSMRDFGSINSPVVSCGKRTGLWPPLPQVALDWCSCTIGRLHAVHTSITVQLALHPYSPISPAEQNVALHPHWPISPAEQTEALHPHSPISRAEQTVALHPHSPISPAEQTVL